MIPERRWFSVKEISEFLGVSIKGCYDMIAAGKIPAARVGRLVRVDLRALEADLEAQVQGVPAAVHKRGGTK
jgi:excisionase family DNA binding protein